MEGNLESIKNNSGFGLESRLQHILKPVRPDPVFVDALKFKLTQPPSIVVETGRQHIELIAIGAGLAVGLLAFLIYSKINKNS